ncbi:MAG TPA: exodeoxyribonuclease V subunit alpha [Holophaga sp.]|nr:exodeoxyribonuclease V subunit alpha [Holophaga sp.]HPS66639.1 exodeoxyribonuclease V subunit alpha [Holophaga sp.]
MFDTGLPPLSGVLASPEERRAAERWQKALGSLAQPEGLLAMAHWLAAVPPGLVPAARQDLTLLLLLLLVNQAQGSSYLPLGDAARLRELQEPFGPPAGDWADLLRHGEVQCLLAGPGAPLRLEGDRLYSGRLLALEARLAEQARARAARPASARSADAGVMESPRRLDGPQREAVAAAVAGSLTLVTGGPGTGKTAIAVAMLRSLLRGESPLRPEEILLAAPTGKAAQRMGQSIRRALRELAEARPLEAPDQALDAMEPRTLHRLLGWDPGTEGFRHHAANPLAAGAVIVDEASMIDLELMSALFAAVPPACSLVLLGDADQLPSVEAGRAFRDLVDALPGCRQVLVHSFRMRQEDPGGRHILAAARGVNAGDAAAFWRADPEVPVRERFEELSGAGVELLAASPENLEAFCRDWAQGRIWTVAARGGLPEAPLGALAFPPLAHRGGAEPFGPGDLARVRRLIDHYDRGRILCPVNAGAHLRSVESLNAFFHGQAVAMAMARGGLELGAARIAGEPVMARRNDYARGLFNGDQGVVMLVERGGEIHREVFFPKGDGFLNFPLAAIQEGLDLCYAMTVHKSQGSEFERIALVLPERPGPLLTREILYTALTRAQKAATILGGRSILEEAIRKPVVRWSGLADRIQVG